MTPEFRKAERATPFVFLCCECGKDSKAHASFTDPGDDGATLWLCADCERTDHHNAEDEAHAQSITAAADRTARAQQFARILNEIAALSDKIFDLATAEENAENDAIASDYYHAGEQLRKLVQDLDHHTAN